METEEELIVPPHLAGRRLDWILAQLLPQYSRVQLRQWIDAGGVHLADRMARGSARLEAGARLRLDASCWPQRTVGLVMPEALPLQVVHEDQWLAVLDKPPGLVVHPGAGNGRGTLQHGLVHRWPHLAALPRAGLIHRLDKDTSGLLVVALEEAVALQLTAALAQRRITRHYVAWVVGQLAGSGVVDAPIARHPVHRTRMAVVPRGRPARTHYQAAAHYREATRLDIQLDTGRTHQIRVHMAHIGHPVMGDPVYGSKRSSCALRRQALHACTLGLRHPVTGEDMLWHSSLPVDLADWAARLSCPDDLAAS
jgi:23S rRNA pseudouridine1911/1915/1917 synthase